MSTRNWLLLFGLVTGLLNPLISSAAEQPNFLLIMCDDLGWGDVGFHGNTVIQTPHLDEMAANSLRFTRFYAASAVCSPTRGSFVTGRHPSRYGIHTANDGHLLPDELSLAELLKQQGYVTGHFGKWHLGTLTETVRDSNRGGRTGSKHFSPPWNNGFDVCFSTEAKVPTYDPMLKPSKQASGDGWEPIADQTQAVPYGTRYWDERGEIITDNLEGDDSRVIVDRVVPFLRQAAKEGQPFLAIVWFHAPHLPVVASPKHRAMYAEYSSYQQNYYGCITALDEQIGRLRASLKEFGIDENTLVTFCSDNGPEGREGEAPGSAGPFRGRKRDLFEGGIRVPGLIEWPARIAPGSTDFPAVTSDYLPTVLDILDVDLPNDRPFDGISLLALFDGALDERPVPIPFTFKGKLALSDNRFKLVSYPVGMIEGNDETAIVSKDGDRTMLFDLLADPGEATDLGDRHTDVVRHMMRTLNDWQQSCRETSSSGE
ncbi:MAG: sulfatase-like hydrolase/transferase [Planctomycetaceae bacterium]|nr:sulfatase-like hydrolase/transferase [Planctomycetaceae bacterium]